MQLLPRSFILVLGIVWAATSRMSAEVTVVDDLHRRVVLAAAAERVVSLAPSITETLFALGAGGQVIGVTDFCNYPPEAQKKHRVGGITNPSIETIIGLKPDLIILSMEGNVREDFRKLLDLRVPLFVTNPRTLAGINKSIDDLGKLTGKEDNALRLVESMKAREDSLGLLPKRSKHVLLIVSLQPLIVLGTNTFLAELLHLAGGENIAGDSPSTYPTLSREVVVERNPDVIIVTSNILQNVDELLELFPEWIGLNAIRNHQVYRINPDIISRPGPRVVEGLEALYNIIQQGHE
jgi:iron complex transport system substrate-binding protein